MLGMLQLCQDLSTAGDRGPRLRGIHTARCIGHSAAWFRHMWTVKFRNGNIKRFKFPIRTVPEGEVDIFAGVGSSSADPAKIKEPGLFTQQAAGTAYSTPS